jgi:hypothetical protein
MTVLVGAFVVTVPVGADVGGSFDGISGNDDREIC